MTRAGMPTVSSILDYVGARPAPAIFVIFYPVILHFYFCILAA